MKWTEIAARANVLRNVPLSTEGRKLGGDTMAELILLRVAYDRKAEELQLFMADVAKGLKPKGYDERERKAARHEELSKKSDRTADEDRELRESITKEELESHERERKDMEKAFQEAQAKKMEEDVDPPAKPLSRKALAELCELIGAEGCIALQLPGQDEPLTVTRAQMLTWLAQMVEG